MDHFERQLARLMHSAQEHIPFEPEQRERLRAGVRSRRRVRAVQRAAGSALAVAGLGIVILLWPHAPVRNEPSGPDPRPAISPSDPATTSPTPDTTESETPSSSATTIPPYTGGPPTTSAPPATEGSSDPSTPAATESADTATSGSTVTAPPPSASSTARVDTSGEPSSVVSPSG
ncbi:hypothetical protein [Streptomyces sp. HUAS TT20]|uniref:hypothetical protein n=1 Tax=Streptomyces sp. HUAS TT20 TaxID=3447509 RepID=UPI0021D9EEA6|nr:hypothetical protein [Streptomyces sp. HUAS 15-9]UXY31658.1 hypothetical protein N8I87_37345 [Streptomyces sp. HUAS 15-9]